MMKNLIWKQIKRKTINQSSTFFFIFFLVFFLKKKVKKEEMLDGIFECFVDDHNEVDFSFSLVC